jgi:hypothetical protein
VGYFSIETLLRQMVGWQMYREEFEGRVRGITEVLPRHLSGGIEENHETGYICQPKIEAITS